MEVTVDVLLSLPFEYLKYDEKKKVVLHGKPRPLLNWCTIYPDGRRLIFDKASYDNISWLTGSTQTQRLFCWPCLLFNNSNIGNWNKYGVSNSSFLLEHIRIHEKTPAHMQSCLNLQMFTMQSENSSVQALLQTRAKFNLRNREIWKHLIDLVYLHVTKKQFAGSRNYICRLEIDDCVKSLQFVRSYNARKRNEIDSAIELIKESPKFLNDIVDSITGILKDSIRKETQMSTYVSLILNEHSNTSEKSLISTVLHYLKNGEVCERFVGFYNLERCKSVDGVYDHVAKVISEFNISERFLAYSLGGGILQTSCLSHFVKDVMKTYYPFSFFVPWHAHELKKVLQRSLSRVKEYKQFFETLSAIKNFFQGHSKRWKEFEEFVGVEYFEAGVTPSSSDTWFTESEATQVLCSYRKYFIHFFDSILQNCQRWDTEDIAQVYGFYQYLENFQTVFLLHVFSTVFKLTSNFNLYLKTKTPELIFSWCFLEDLKNDLRRPKWFTQVWSHSLADVENKKSKSSLKWPEFPSALKYSLQFQKIIDLIIFEIDIRFGELRSLDFLNLLAGRGDMLVTDYYVEKLQRLYGQYFKEDEILAELRVLAAYPSFIPKEAVDALFHFFFKFNLSNTFPSLYQLTELGMTLPTRRCSNDCGVAKLETIAKWAYLQEQIAIAGDVSMLCIEWECVEELKKGASFYDEVISKFCDFNRTI